MNLSNAKNYDEFTEILKQCTKCPLHETRIQVVVGEGNPNADILLIGEAPGENEDIQGIPFIGMAGKRLREILRIVGFNFSDIYITNIVKCRPPGNRDPEEIEKNICGEWLLQQIRDYIQPKVIVGLGRHSSKIFRSDFNLKEHHGLLFELNDTTQFMGTYHPAASLYNPSLKKELISDFEYLRKQLYKETLHERFFE